MDRNESDDECEFSMETFAEAFVAQNFATPFTEQLTVRVQCMRFFVVVFCLSYIGSRIVVVGMFIWILL